MKITIKLLSDLCTASGETYNSIVDTDVVYDSYGLPYIPAKRIKGCIREAALEMRDFGLISQEDFTTLFGKEGHLSSEFTLSNAYLTDYAETVRALEACRDVDFVSQQRVLEQYTSMRTQTAVDLNTGVADENSLRTLRVVNKGVTFEAECAIVEKNALQEKVKSQEELKEKLAQAVSLVKHMGLARTRGLGLVEMQLREGDAETASHVNVDGSKLQEHNKLRYTITLQSAMICKSAQGNQASTQDYIAGSKVLGILAGVLGQAEYRKLTESNDVVVTNAYIMHNGERCAVGAASLQKEKDQSWQQDGTMTILDMRYAKDVEKQMTPAGIDYMGADGTKVDVSTEISYHHQRPNDKSIGRATGDDADGSSFYQLCSISEGQSFCGYIYANREQAEQILNAVKKLGKVRMGYGKSSEFGAVDFVIDRNDGIETTTPMIVQDAAVTLTSDVVLYNENGCLSTELPVLKQYLCEALGASDLKIENPFLVFTTIGGYNVTWGTRKPIFNAFGKGTSFLIHSDAGLDLNVLNRIFIGERVAEGFGEVAAVEPGEGKVTVRKLAQESQQNLREYKNTGIMQDLMQSEFEKMVQKEIMDRLDGKKAEYRKKSDGFNAAVSKIRLVYKSVVTGEKSRNEESCDKKSLYAVMRDEIKGIESDEKQDLCWKLIDLVKLDDTESDLGKEISAKFKEKYKVDFKPKMSEQELFQYVYRIYITELKHFAKTLDKEVADNGR